MLKKILRKASNLLGLEIIIRKKPKTQTGFGRGKKVDIANTKGNALDSHFHLELARKYYDAGNYFTAWAELKTAECLGLDQEVYDEYREEYWGKIPELTAMNHNQYYRFHTLSEEIKKRKPTSDTHYSVLDVGGGFGELASFINDSNYCLVEPLINGIDGLEIPFENESFDLVVSCHVFEHIPEEEREAFLDQLVSKCKKGVILLNPIHVDNTHDVEALELIVDISDAYWAKEHLDCGLPTIESVASYAEKKNLKFSYSPNGTITTAMALVFFDFSGRHLGLDSYEKVNRFFNTKYSHMLDSEDFPNAGLFYLEKK